MCVPQLLYVFVQKTRRLRRATRCSSVDSWPLGTQPPYNSKLNKRFGTVPIHTMCTTIGGAVYSSGLIHAVNYTCMTYKEIPSVKPCEFRRTCAPHLRRVSPSCAKMYLELERFRKDSSSHQLNHEISKKLLSI